jgi:RNA polymerase sigma-70 factor (ECF subfamily)
VVGWLPELIDDLPATYRDAVRLHEIEGLSQQAVADRLGLSLSGAKSRVQRGRERLRAELERCCSFELDRRGNVLDYERRAAGACCDVCGDEPDTAPPG